MKTGGRCVKQRGVSRRAVIPKIELVMTAKSSLAPAAEVLLAGVSAAAAGTPPSNAMSPVVLGEQLGGRH